MKEFVHEVMSRGPSVVAPDLPVLEVARRMGEEDLGDVIVASGHRVTGIITDRDIVVRVVAAGLDPATTPVAAVCTKVVRTAAPDEMLRDVADVMRTHAIRRMPVVDEDEVVGVVAISDLATEIDAGPVLADIASAGPSTERAGSPTRPASPRGAAPPRQGSARGGARPG